MLYPWTRKVGYRYPGGFLNSLLNYILGVDKAI